MPVPDTSDESQLRELYVERRKSLRDIAEIFGCSYRSVWNVMDDLGIERRTSGEGSSVSGLENPAGTTARLARGEIPACPECDRSETHQTIPDDPRGGAARANWRCNPCGAAFDHPNWRARKAPAHASGLSKRLADADPDDVGGRGRLE